MTEDNLKPETATDANTVLADSKKFAYEVREEKELFDRLGIQYVEPKYRTL